MCWQSGYNICTSDDLCVIYLLMMPPASPHAVFTPEDCLAIGGHFFWTRIRFRRLKIQEGKTDIFNKGLYDHIYSSLAMVFKDPKQSYTLFKIESRRWPSFIEWIRQCIPPRFSKPYRLWKFIDANASSLHSRDVTGQWVARTAERREWQSVHDSFFHIPFSSAALNVGS